MTNTDFVEDIVKRKFPDATEAQVTAAAERARAKAIENGGGIAQLYTDSEAAAEVIIKEAMNEITAKAKLKGELDLKSAELTKLEMQRLCFGKAGADKPLAHRGEYVRKYGEADYQAAMKIWGASATDLSPRKNPYSKPVRKALRQARRGTLEPTDFNNDVAQRSR